MYRQNGEEGSKTRCTLHLPTTRQSRMYLNPGLGHNHFYHLSLTVLTPPFLDHRERQTQDGLDPRTVISPKCSWWSRTNPGDTCPCSRAPLPSPQVSAPKRSRERQERAGQRKPRERWPPVGLELGGTSCPGHRGYF